MGRKILGKTVKLEVVLMTIYIQSHMIQWWRVDKTEDNKQGKKRGKDWKPN